MVRIRLSIHNSFLEEEKEEDEKLETGGRFHHKMKLSIFLFLILLQCSHPIKASIEEICKQATSNNIDSYKFCITTLKSKTKTANQEDIFAIASDLMMDAFHRNLRIIQELQEEKGLSKKQQNALRFCFTAYGNGISKMEQVFFRYKLVGVDIAKNCVGAGIDQVALCNEAFVKEGIKSLMVEENEEAINLARLASQLIPPAKA
ncbi:uncharacterized protein A4U43_C04F17000 [Asparagus officinalis]|uniref:Pectinesterase inhibitor domain-containing protein n=1 Tax=Asparagus officinalis TaxID=4686 RepID=A0A5P1F1Z7_ASPOF|nr:uncharacterized protein A4U43_C04F17000 [Asparagus officinalis]